MEIKRLDKLEEVFQDDIDSIEKYIHCINKIKKILNKQPEVKRNQWKFCYRGDRADSNVQCTLFKNGFLETENSMFQFWQDNCGIRNQGVCSCKHKGSLLCLAYMQHYCRWGTRLLDFSSDPLVALRFACGKDGQNEEKKVTMYITDFISAEEYHTKEDHFLQLVNSDLWIAEANRDIYEDTFIEIEKPSFEEQADTRIERQKGIFLFMGNRKSVEETNPRHDRKVAHKLSASVGRGKGYDGYVGVLKIAASKVEKIRDELDSTCKYNIHYLMNDKEEENEKSCAKCYLNQENKKWKCKGECDDNRRIYE